jgi:hypothetical protein
VFLEVASIQLLERFVFPEGVPAEDRPVRPSADQLVDESMSIILQRDQFLSGQFKVHLQDVRRERWVSQELGVQGDRPFEVFRENGTAEGRSFAAHATSV